MEDARKTALKNGLRQLNLKQLQKVIRDLSHRDSFNDEPSEMDYPKYRIVITKTRVPWIIETDK